jgi:hypothetical protein
MDAVQVVHSAGDVLADTQLAQVRRHHIPAPVQHLVQAAALDVLLDQRPGVVTPPVRRVWGVRLQAQGSGPSARVLDFRV